MTKLATHPLGWHMLKTPATIRYQKLLEQKRQERQIAESHGRIKLIT